MLPLSELDYHNDTFGYKVVYCPKGKTMPSMLHLYMIGGDQAFFMTTVYMENFAKLQDILDHFVTNQRE